MSLFAAMNLPTLALCGLLLVLVPWLLFTELSYLGSGATRRLYNLLAGKYEKKWRRREYASAKITQRLFLDPLRQALDQGPDARLLDLACGSGRISLMVLRSAWFEGRIDAIDISESMLARFRESLQKLPESQQSRVNLEAANLVGWKAPGDRRYDAVAFTEASEFVAGLPQLLGQVSRALKPGGLLLLTKTPWWVAWLYVGRNQTSRSMRRLLQQHGFERVDVAPWMSRYDVVYAWKHAAEEPTASVPRAASAV